MAVAHEEHVPEELERVAKEQAALLRIATLVAGGATEADVAAAVTAEIGQFFRARRANTMRWDGDTIRVIGDWDSETGEMRDSGRVFAFGGDTISARVVDNAGPARIDASAELKTDFAQQRWAELGLEASIGAPLYVDGKVWGVVSASRYPGDDPFPPGAEYQLRDFAALVVQAIVNAEARRETAQLIAEQSALRRIATLVAAGRSQADVLDAVNAETARLFEATSVTLVRWEGVQDEVVVDAAWTDPSSDPVEPGSRYHPTPGGATLSVLETGLASQSNETSAERGSLEVIAAPVIVKAALLGALTASRPAGNPFPAGAEIRLRSFADLAAQSIANERAQVELRASRVRIVRAADETRRRLERNLHDGAQQRLVSVSVALRMAAAALPSSPDQAHTLLTGASDELTQALEELRDLARGLHPTLLTECGLGPAIESLATRVPVPVSVENTVDERLPEAVEAALYYVVSESLTNVAKHAGASEVVVRSGCTSGVAEIEVADDGVGGASVNGGSGIRGLVDRIEALGGSFRIESPPGEGTRVSAAIPLADPAAGY